MMSEELLLQHQQQQRQQENQMNANNNTNSNSDNPEPEILEQGDIYFFYRPRKGAEEVKGIEDISVFHGQFKMIC